MSIQNLLDKGRSAISSNPIINTGVSIALNFRYGKEPQPSFLWDVELPTIDGIEPPLVLETTIPFSKFSVDSYYINSNKIGLPLSVDTGDISITFLQDKEGKAIEYIESWIKKVRNKENGTYNYSNTYKKNVVVNFLSKSLTSFNFIEATKSKAVMLTYKGVFPIGINDMSLDYKSSEAMTINVSFSVDDVSIERQQGMAEKVISNIKQKFKNYLS